MVESRFTRGYIHVYVAGKPVQCAARRWRRHAMYFCAFSVVWSCDVTLGLFGDLCHFCSCLGQLLLSCSIFVVYTK